jgi:hypothetical protein
MTCLPGGKIVTFRMPKIALGILIHYLPASTFDEKCDVS